MPLIRALVSYNSLENPIGIETISGATAKTGSAWSLQLIRKPDRDWNQLQHVNDAYGVLLQLIRKPDRDWNFGDPRLPELLELPLQLIRKPDRDWNQQSYTVMQQRQQQQLQLIRKPDRDWNLEPGAVFVRAVHRLQLIRKPDRDWN